MVRYIIFRLLRVIAIVLVVIFILFVLLYTLPGSRVGTIPISGYGDALDDIFESLNVKDGLLTKYIRYCYNVFVHFSFKSSPDTRYRTVSLIRARTLTTVYILVCGLALTLILGVPIGVYTAIRKNRPADRLINSILMLASSIPSYSIALLILLVFCAYLKILPVIVAPRTPVSYIMPTLTVAISGMSSVARMTRAYMLEVLEQPYITALRAKGIKESSVIYRHALKNALIPIISFLRGFSAQLLCGTLVVEQFFTLPGIGMHLLGAVSTRNHDDLLGGAVVMTIILALMNIVSDVAYAVFNPQIRLKAE
ncbi:MAG: ABC transporter permease [Oscillospiraceae bacterium]|nr:ABC transporter permease [Oscillospiraceae bacterium]